MPKSLNTPCPSTNPSSPFNAAPHILACASHPLRLTNNFWLAAFLSTTTFLLVNCASLYPSSTQPPITAQTVAQQQVHPPEKWLLDRVNSEVNQLGKPCPDDYCNPDWPLSAELVNLEYWDCKARAVAKAERLIKEHGFAKERLAYIIIKGPQLRVAHTALLVDGTIILDSGTICEICNLPEFTKETTGEAILPVADLMPLIKAYRSAHDRP